MLRLDAIASGYAGLAVAGALMAGGWYGLIGVSPALAQTTEATAHKEVDATPEWDAASEDACADAYWEGTDDDVDCDRESHGGTEHERAADVRNFWGVTTKLQGLAPSDLDAELPDDEIELVEPEPPETVVVFGGTTVGNKIALTFDDGPSRYHTARILNILKRHGVRATFFVEGRRVAKLPELTRRITDEGHEIASHASSHTSFRSLFKSQMRSELEETQHAIEAATGRRPRFFRPPFGRYPESALPVFGEFGLDVVLWTVDSGDWHEGPWDIFKTVTSKARPGSIVLLHDRKPQTVDALPDLLKRLKQRGLVPVTVSEITGLAAYQ